LAENCYSITAIADAVRPTSSIFTVSKEVMFCQQRIHLC